MSKTAQPHHSWRFFRAGGFDQVRLETGAAAKPHTSLGKLGLERIKTILAANQKPAIDELILETAVR